MLPRWRFFIVGLCFLSLRSLANPVSPPLSLIIALWQAPPEPLHPFLLEGEEAEYLAPLLFQPLRSLDQSGQWQCRLCARAPEVVLPQVVRGGGHGRKPVVPLGQSPVQVSLELKSDLKWGDGVAISGRDLLFTWQVAQKFLGKTSPAALYSSIAELEVDQKNPLLITITLNARQFTLEQFAKFPLLPQHLEAPLWEQSKGDIDQYLQLSNYRSNPTHPGLYSGPFVVAAEGRPHGLTLTRQRFFPRSSPVAASKTRTIDEIKIKFIKNLPPTSHGEVQMMPEVTCRHLNCRTLAGPLALMHRDSSSYEHVDFNVGNPLLRDLSVRRALTLALDRTALYRALAPMEVRPAGSFLHPARGIDTATAYGLLPYDFKKAEALLDAAGWVRPQPDAIRRKGIAKLELDLVSSDLDFRRSEAAFLIAQWRALGVGVRHQLVSEAHFRDHVLRKRDFSGMVLYAWRLPVDASLSPIFHSKAVPRQSNHFQGQNISGWYAGRVDTLCDELDSRPFSLSRVKALTELQQLYLEQLPGVPLYFHEQLLRVDPRLEGLVRAGHQEPSSASAAEWTWRE